MDHRHDAICWRGIELSANFQKALLGIEVVMLMVLAVTALVKVANHTGATAAVKVHGAVHHVYLSVHPSWSWILPTNLPFSAFISGLILMLFIYWGWDTAVSVNEETKDKAKTPGRAAIISTVILLVTYFIAIFGVQAYAGIGSNGIGLGNSDNEFDTLSGLGGGIFGTSGFGSFLARLLFLMILSSAAASTQTTILPTARTTLSMAAYKALPARVRQDAPPVPDADRVHVVMGAISIALYIAVQLHLARQPDRRRGHRDRPVHRVLLRPDRVLLRLVLPQDAPEQPAGPVDARDPAAARRTDHVHRRRHQPADRLGGQPDELHRLDHAWHALVVGGVFLIAAGSALAGVLGFIYVRIASPAFFRKETLTRATPTLVPDE